MNKRGAAIARLRASFAAARTLIAKTHGLQPDWTLDELLEGMTDENVHPETDWGPDVGKERSDNEEQA